MQLDRSVKALQFSYFEVGKHPKLFGILNNFQYEPGLMMKSCQKQ